MIPRRSYTAAQREAALEACNRLCHLCGFEILPGQDWQMSHVAIPHEHGGEEVAPAHRICHAVETAEITAPLIAKVRRVRRKHNGSLEPSFTMPCSRRSHWKKKIAGGMERRVRGFERERQLRALSPELDFTQTPLMRQIESRE